MFNDAVVGNGLADEGIAAWHLQHILGWVERQVNEGRNGWGESSRLRSYSGTDSSDKQQ
jgi:hypothetical protein